MNEGPGACCAGAQGYGLIHHLPTGSSARRIHTWPLSTAPGARIA